MKKLTISFLAVIFSIGAAFSQPVSDQGVVPIGVTLNSILRLNITSGGNMEFVVNTINQYQNGINPLLTDARYDTHFTVASSVDFDVFISTDAATFIGVDDVGHTIPLNNIGYLVDEDAGATGVDNTNWDLPSDVFGLEVGPTPVIGGNYAGLGAGDINQNGFVIHWTLGTGLGIAAHPTNAATLLAQSITSDRYVVNAIIELSQHTVAVVVD